MFGYLNDYIKVSRISVKLSESANKAQLFANDSDICISNGKFNYSKALSSIVHSMWSKPKIYKTGTNLQPKNALLYWNL